MKLFSIKDIKIDAWGPLFEARNANEVNRSLTALVNDEKQKENQLYKHPQDFELYEVGEKNEDTGVVTGLTSPKQHFCLGNLKIPKQ